MESLEHHDNTQPNPPNIFLNSVGIIFIAVWFIAHVVYILMGFMASVMSIEAGRNSVISINLFVYGFMFAQILTAISGYHLGMFISKTGFRKKYFIRFCLYFFCGVIIKITLFSLWFN